MLDDADNDDALGNDAQAEASLREAVAIGDRGRRGEQSPVEGRKLLAHFLRSRERFEESEQIFREGVEIARRSNAPHELGHNLVDLGKVLIDQGKYADAVVALREALAVREQHHPEGWWGTFDTMSTLGGALTSLGRYTQAEPLLIEGYEGMHQDPLAWPVRQQESLERLVELYQKWDAAEPGQGHSARARSWREKLPASPAPATNP